MYSKIDARFWEDEKTADLTIYGQHLMLYLLTCKHRNMFGCYRLPVEYMAADTKIPYGEIEGVLNELVATGMVNYDAKQKIVHVKNFMKYNPIENPNQVKAALDRLADMPDCTFFETVAQTLIAIGKEHLEPLIKGLRERLPKGFREPMPEPVTVTVYSNSIQESNGGGNNSVVPEEALEAKPESSTTDDLPAEMRDPVLAEVITTTLAEGGSTFTPTQAQECVHWIDEVGGELVLYAVKAAKEGAHNGFGWKYLKSILKRWERDRLTTPALVDAHERRRDEERARSGTSSREPPGGRYANLNALRAQLAEEENDKS